MTFGSEQYVPVLKIKRGEKKALQLMEASLRPRITPFLEIVERKGEKTPTADAHLDKAFRDLAQSVSGYSRCFLEARELAPDGSPTADAFFGRAADAGITFTPVTGISRSGDTDAAMRYRERGVALRLTRDELERGGLASRLMGFMVTHGLSREEADLIIDLGPVDDMITDGVAAFAEAFLADVPEHARWRTFTISACAFPPGMGGLGRQSHDLVERVDWIAWRDRLHGRRDAIPRLPTFSDGAIQHPMGVEGFNPRTMQASASIRYTLPNAWLRIKGQSLRNTPGSEQFADIATQLVYGHLREHYAGADHCEGCRLIKLAADGAPKLGSPEVWRRLGTIHHMTMVMQGLASLPSP